MKNSLILAFIFSLISCTGERTDSSASSATTIDFEKELAGIEATRSNFILAIKEGRYQDIGQWVTSDVKTIRAGGSGWDNMFALGKDRGRFPYDSIVMNPTETYIMNDSMAYDWGSSKTYYTNENGEQVELRNSFLVIMKKVDGEWKLHREVASSVLE